MAENTSGDLEQYARKIDLSDVDEPTILRRAAAQIKEGVVPKENATSLLGWFRNWQKERRLRKIVETSTPPKDPNQN